MPTGHNLPERSHAETLDERVRQEALNQLYRALDDKQHIASVFVPLLVVAVMWSAIDHRLLVAWALAFVVSILGQRAVARAYAHQPEAARREKRWGRLMTATTGINGLLWAAAVFLFYVPDSVPHQVFMFSLAIALSSGSIYRALYWLPSVYVYALPILAVLVLRLALEGTLPFLILAGLLLWSAVFVVRLAVTLNRTVLSEMRLRRRSEDLAKRLQVKTADAERAMRAKSRFLAAASHDLRQPLHALTLFVHTLKECRAEDERASMLRRIDQSLDALKKLFDGLLDVSRLDANVIVPEPRHFDVAALLGDLAEEYGSVAHGKNLKLRLRTRPAVVVSDPVLLERVIRNLLANAVRYTKKGGVLLSTRLREGEVLLQVWDTGIGIPEEHREEVFHEFTQLHNAHRDRADGLGLGLAIVQRLCWLLQIPIEWRSRVGHGSVFGLHLQRGDTARISNAPTTSGQPRWDLSGRCVVVIDDEPDVLDAMNTLLTQWGLTVIVASTQTAALQALQQRGTTPDLMLVDLRLAESSNGIDVMNEIRARFKVTIPGILITGDTDADQILLAHSSGYMVLHKPVRPPRLRALVQQTLAAGRSSTA